MSSQFDADRLDYLRRDRLMTGVRHGEFDFSWLFANLEVGFHPRGEGRRDDWGSPGFHPGEKGDLSGGGIRSGLFHLYIAVYFHKATRSAEKMLAAIIARVGELVRDGTEDAAGLNADHPLIRFLGDPADLEFYLRLDDFVIWSALFPMSEAEDEAVSTLASRLLGRKLYKAVEVSARVGEAEALRFRARLSAASKAGEFAPTDVLLDVAVRDPYQRRSFDSLSS